ncbi:MAG: bifunctional metallophosphatase/5'-nucleotidase [Fibrobacteria bacterium]|nr:bifunctional metallophosphatase/5'-nucleotidase [Fibrobacteria bacterium]
MNQRSRFALTLAVLTFCHAPALAAPGSSATFLAWTDLHGEIPSGLKLLVDSAREASKTSGRPLVVVDGGEAFLGSRIAHLTRGLSSTAEMNWIRPDAMTLGLGDFDWDRSRLDSLLKVIDFPVLTANLRRNVDDEPIGGSRSLLCCDDSGTIGIVGIGDPDLDYPQRPARNGDMRVDPVANAVEGEVSELRAKGARLVAVLVHGGSSVAQTVAKIPGVDLVLLAPVPGVPKADLPPRRVGKTWIATLPAGGAQVARIDLESTDTGWTISVAPVKVPAGRPLNAAWKSMRNHHDSLVAAFQAREVGVLRQAWPTTRREGPLGDWMADALRIKTGSDIAFVPASWIRSGFPKGKVRVGDVWNAVPPGLNMASVFTLPGSDVMKVLQRQMRRSKEFLFVSGLTCSPDSSMFGGNPIAATVGGKPLDKSAYYRIAIPRQLRNDIFELMGISEASANPEWTETWESDLVIEYALEHGLEVEVGRVPPMYGGNAPR